MKWSRLSSRHGHILSTVRASQKSAIHNTGGIVKVSIPPDIVIMLEQAPGRSICMLGSVWGGVEGGNRLDGSVMLRMTRGHEEHWIRGAQVWILQRLHKHIALQECYPRTSRPVVLLHDYPGAV